MSTFSFAMIYNSKQIQVVMSYLLQMKGRYFILWLFQTQNKLGFIISIFCRWLALNNSRMAWNIPNATRNPQVLDSKAQPNFSNKFIMVCKLEPIVSKVLSEIGLGKGGDLLSLIISGGKYGKHPCFRWRASHFESETQCQLREFEPMESKHRKWTLPESLETQQNKTAECRTAPFKGCGCSFLRRNKPRMLFITDQCE